MKISKLHKFVFISTPKACTNSIYKILDEHYSEGLRARGFHDVDIPRRYRSYFRWTVCRNPYSRAVSLWWSACRLAHLDQYLFRECCGAVDDFPRFIMWLSNTTSEERKREPLMMNQTEWLGPVEPIAALHMESLEEELIKLPFWKEGITIPQLNTTSQKIKDQEKHEGQVIVRPSQRDLYQDDKARLAVLRWAGPDFDRFGYSRELE